MPALKRLRRKAISRSRPKYPLKTVESGRNLGLLPSQCADNQALHSRRNASAALPNELWNHIFSYLSKKELKELCLVGSKHLEALASSKPFRTAYIAARCEVLDNLYSWKLLFIPPFVTSSEKRYMTAHDLTHLMAQTRRVMEATELQTHVRTW